VTDGRMLLLQATETLAVQVITGATLSILVIICLHEEVLPQLSDAVHVRVIVESQAVPDFISEKVMVILV